MTKNVDKVSLGRTDLTVSKICFGTASLANMPVTYGYDVDEIRARNTLRAIFEGPGNFLDTSRNYGFGRSEELIGEAIRELGALPDGFVISSKLDRDPETDQFDAARARASLEESLKALGLDRIPLGRVASITGQARSTLTRENGQPTDSNLAQPSSVILLRARTPICASVF